MYRAKLSIKVSINNLVWHFTLKVSHEKATSLYTVTPIPPPFSALTYLCDDTDMKRTPVPSYT
jgi:hypothetical protein